MQRNADVSPEDEDFSDDEDGEEYAPRSIFAAGWFRAVLVLTVLAIVVVIALPYLLDWFEPASAPVKAPARPEVSAPAVTGPPPPSAPPAAAPPAVTQGALPSALPPAESSPVAAPPTGRTPSPAPAKGPAPAAPAPPARPVPPPALAAKPKSQTASAKLPEAKSQTASAKLPEPARPAAAGSVRMAAAASAEAARNYWVQVGIFTDAKNAAGLARKLRADGFSVDVASVTRNPTPSGPAPGTYQVVRAGSFPNEQGAIAARDRLRAKGYDAFLTQGAAK